MATTSSSDPACPVPGCGRASKGQRRGEILQVQCPKHGKVTYNYSEDELKRVER